MKKAILSLVSLVSLLAFSNTQVAAASFTDIESSPMKPQIEKLSS